jgi:hypothetical protein
MSVRVGRIVNNKNPSYEGFIPIVVMTKSSKYGDIGPYCLKNESGHIMENIWQFHKVYEKVPKIKQSYSRWDSRTIWEYPAETHITDGEPNELYWLWREAGLNAVDAIRYPVGTKHRHECLYSLLNGKKLNYVEARKEIYFKEYATLVKQHPKFIKLQKMLADGKSLLITEIDGPHQENLNYYKEKYNVGDDFIENDTMLSTKENLDIMLNDTINAFGHGYCLAACLLNIEL